MYRKIDSWTKDYLEKSYSMRLNGNKSSGTISQKINSTLKLDWFWNCDISADLQAHEVEEISNGNIEILQSKLWPNCFNYNWIPITTLSSIVGHTQDIKIAAKEESIGALTMNKSIADIWVYTDWNVQNSLFDLMKDIENINQILLKKFEKHSWEWSAWNNAINNLFNSSNNHSSRENSNTLSGWLLTENELSEFQLPSAWHESTLWDTQSHISPLEGHILELDNTQYMCAQDTNQSWLWPNELAFLLSQSQIFWESNNNISTPVWWSSYIASGSWTVQEIIENPNIAWIQTWVWINKWNDNEAWGCDWFFCIEVDFVTSNPEPKWDSIESILENANKHLKKFINSSLAQAKMTTNNFELWLRDISLPDMLSLGFVVTKKTPPFLDLDLKKEEQEQKENEPSVGDWIWDYKKNTFFCERWNAQWFDCTRQNDLDIFTDTMGEEKTILNSWDQTLSTISARIEERRKILETSKAKLAFIDLANQKDTQINETKEFEKQFMQLESVTKSMLEHAENFQANVQQMRKIPIHK